MILHQRKLAYDMMATFAFSAHNNVYLCTQRRKRHQNRAHLRGVTLPQKAVGAHFPNLRKGEVR